MTTPRPVVTEEDVRSAQVAVDTWTDGWDFEHVSGLALLELRGVLAAQFSEVRAAGYLEGLTRALDRLELDQECADSPECHVPMLDGHCALCGQVVAP